MYLIRADGNVKTGVGHLMRCLTVADRCSRNKEQVIFLCADKASADVVAERGYPAMVLETDYRDMESELPVLLPWMEKQAQRPVLLADSYYVTDRYLRELGAAGRIVLLDDMGEKRYPVNAVINYNVFASEAHYDKLYRGTGTSFYVGGGYVPLRPQFINRSYQVREQAQNVLITTGGGDSDNIAGKILTAVYREKLNFHLITGCFNPHLKELKEFASKHEGVHIYHDVKDMAGLMEMCDIAITAGGTTVYELASVGVPFVCFSYAPNQEALARYVGEQGIGGYGGAFHLNGEETLRDIADWCDRLLSLENRKRYHEQGKQLTDGQGAERIAGILRGGKGNSTF